MNKLYIPISSLNFNSIFSSESISPAAFYANRGFGYKRFTKVDPNPFENSLLIYNKLPLFSIRDTLNENYPFFIELPESIINEEWSRFEINGVSIYQCNCSLYLSPKWSRIIFQNQSELKSIVVHSEQSLETKLTDRYSKNIVVLDKSSINVFTWSKEYLKSITDIRNISTQHIAFDQSVNKIKGFIYGYIIGALMAKPKEFVELQKQLKEIKNITAGLINIYGNFTRSEKGSKGKTLGYIPKPTYSEIQNRLNDLQKRADITRILLKPYENIEGEIISKFLKKHESEIDVNILLQILKEIRPLKWSFYEQLEWAVSTKGGILSPLLNRLVTSAYNLFKPENNRIIQNDYGINEISESFSALEKKIAIIEGTILSENAKVPVDEVLFFSGTKLSHFSDNLINEKAQSNYKLIINLLLDQPYESTDIFKQSRNDLIYSIGKKFKDETSPEANSQLVLYLNNLMESIESLNKPFNLSATQSPVWKSFAAFFLRGEEPERLLDFLVSQGIDDYRFALGMWGAYFGFANIPRTISNILFDNSEDDYLNKISEFIFSKVHSLENALDIITPIEKNKNIEIVKESEIIYKAKTVSENLDSLNDFYIKYEAIIKPKGWKKEYDDHIKKTYDLVKNLNNLTGDFDFKEFKRRLEKNKPKGLGDEKIKRVIDELRKFVN